VEREGVCLTLSLPAHHLLRLANQRYTLSLVTHHTLSIESFHLISIYNHHNSVMSYDVPGDQISRRERNADQTEGESSRSGVRQEGTTATFTESSVSVDRSNIRAYVTEIDHLIELLREGAKSKLEVITTITQFLNGDGELSPEEKSRSFELYMAEIEMVEDASGKRKGKGRSKGERTSKGDRLVQTSFMGERDQKESRPVEEEFESSASSESEEDEPSRKKRKLRQSDMPWFGRHGEFDAPTHPSCVKSSNLIRKFHRDLKSAKLYIKLAPDAPRGIPMSEWEHIFKGEPIDLDKMLSSLHCVAIDPERKVSIGEAEISIGGAEAKRKVETSSEWATAWRSASRAVAFVFEHRQRELVEYGDYIERLFAAKRSGSHGQVILFDKGVRNEVGGGQAMLLTDYHCFTSLYTTTLQDDGIEYHKGRRGGGSGKPGEAKGEVCLRFNSQNGCRFTEAACKYQHTCQSCGQTGHGKPSCGKGS
jgi:hypothetical protein